MRLDVGRYYIAVEFGDARSIGIGWWTRRHWMRWFIWSKLYYDGNWFGVRIGPFFYCRGPY